MEFYLAAADGRGDSLAKGMENMCTGGILANGMDMDIRECCMMNGRISFIFISFKLIIVHPPLVPSFNAGAAPPAVSHAPLPAFERLLSWPCQLRASTD